MLKNHTLSIAAIALCSAFASCTNIKQTMREPNSRVEFQREDFVLSPQVSASAKTIKVLGIDFPRFIRKEEGYISGSPRTGVPVIGNFVSDKTANYALYNLMRNNPGYDVAFYPQYEIKVFRPVIGIGFLVKITTASTTARLGKLEADED